MIKRFIKWIFPVWELYDNKEGMNKIYLENIMPWNWKYSHIKYDGLNCVLIKTKRWFE